MNTWNKRSPSLYAVLFGWFALCGSGGCRPDDSGGDGQAGADGTQSAVPFDQTIYAQGQLMPAGGIIQIVAPPGDRLENIQVTEGETVSQGAPVGRLAGQALRESELEVARAELKDAQAKTDAAVAAARADLKVAQVGVNAKEEQLDEATSALERAKGPGGEFELLQGKVDLQKTALENLRKAAEGGDTRPLVGESAVKQQELTVKASEAELASAKREFALAVRSAEVALEAAQSELAAAEKKIESAERAFPKESLQRKIALLEQQIKASELVAPVSGNILAIDMQPGQPTTGMPIMRMADLSELVCRAEVPLALIPRIETGASAKISGGVLGTTSISGTVESVSMVAGSPRLPSPDPRQQVDYRSAVVVIKLDSDALSLNPGLVSSQVDVAIQAKE